MRRITIYIFFAILLFGFFSFRLIEVPNGVSGDEMTLGYNAVLLERTLHDQTGRFLPIFAQSPKISGWLTPVIQYSTAVIFKAVGPSLINLRIISTILAVSSALLIFVLGKKVLGKMGGFAASIFLITTPVILIQSHLALDNIAPVPFIVLWLLGIFLFEKSKKKYWLVCSAISLGIAYYSYKGARVFVPVWSVLTLLYLGREYLVHRTKKSFRGVLKPVSAFTIAILPFYLIIPYLEVRYAGAVLNNQRYVFEGVYKFLYPYLSMFDPSFLFIRGDDVLMHSTGIHGMYLLASLPFFIFGLTKVWGKSAFWKLIIISFFAGPFLFGIFGSVHRASRMLSEVPLYSLISAAGFVAFLEKRRLKIILVIIIILFAANFYDFWNYYMWQYGPATGNIFLDYNSEEAQYKTLKKLSDGKNLTPYVDKVITDRTDSVSDFTKVEYFVKFPESWDTGNKNFPVNGILMTDNDHVSYLKLIEKVGNLFYYVKISQ